MYKRQAQTALLGYGHLPLMLTRACPLQNVRGCAGCGRQGFLTDRKNARFPVLCRHGARHIYNPVPLYMGERRREMNCDWITLYFSCLLYTSDIQWSTTSQINRR